MGIENEIEECLKRLDELGIELVRKHLRSSKYRNSDLAYKNGVLYCSNCGCILDDGCDL